MNEQFFAVATHPDYGLLDGYATRELNGTEARAVANHVLWCVQCRATVNFRRSVVQLIERNRASLTGATETDAATSA
jgi:hypothetical protein